MKTYIYEREDWPHFRWDWVALHEPLAAARHRQGVLFGKMASLGVDLQAESVLEALTDEVQKSSEIEGEHLDREHVRSSVARRLGMDLPTVSPVDRSVEGVVAMVLDATQQYGAPLTTRRLWGWHSALFPTGHSGRYRIRVASWRDDSAGPMQVISGPIGRERVHYQAPTASRVASEMSSFLRWFETCDALDAVLKVALAHLWFVTVHPFDDGNGRIARAIADLALARAEKSTMRFYSMSAQIRKERNDYYAVLEQTQRGDLDVTEWLVWFLGCMERAIAGAERDLQAVQVKACLRGWLQGLAINERQRMMLNRLVDGFRGNLTTKKWSQLGKCSHDSALRDIHDLISKGALVQDAAGRSTSYSLNPSMLEAVVNARAGASPCPHSPLWDVWVALTELNQEQNSAFEQRFRTVDNQVCFR